MADLNLQLELPGGDAATGAAAADTPGIIGGDELLDATEEDAADEDDLNAQPSSSSTGLVAGPRDAGRDD